MYQTDATAKFLIMNDIEKRAKELTRVYEEKGGLTECHSRVGYKMFPKNWRDAKDAGFIKEPDKKWIGFTSSYAGNGGYAEQAYQDALNEKKEEIGQPSFLDEVHVYEYLI